jgi:orotate phosphoribosyltransferase
MVALSDRDLKHTVVRKPHENAHSGSYAGQWIPKGTKVAIVDDFISSGETIEEIVKYIQSNNLDLQAIIVWSIRSSYKTPKECELIVLEDEDD